MMGDTYCKIAEIKNEWMRQWARTVLIVERGIPPAERMRQQNLYAERMATGEQALVLKQTMSVRNQRQCHKTLEIILTFFFQNEQLEEIEDIIEMKVAHRKNINRRKDRFGFESNSLIGLDINTSVVQMDEDEENPFENAQFVEMHDGRK